MPSANSNGPEKKSSQPTEAESLLPGWLDAWRETLRVIRTQFLSDLARVVRNFGTHANLAGPVPWLYSLCVQMHDRVPPLRRWRRAAERNELLRHLIQIRFKSNSSFPITYNKVLRAVAVQRLRQRFEPRGLEMSRNILIGAAAISLLLSATLGASAGPSFCRTAARVCPHTVNAELVQTSLCKVTRACPITH
jgi:hypothetical protein